MKRAALTIYMATALSMACASLSLTRFRDTTIVLATKPIVNDVYTKRYGPGVMLNLAREAFIPIAFTESPSNGTPHNSAFNYYCLGSDQDDPMIKSISVGALYTLTFNLISQDCLNCSYLHAVMIVHCASITPVQKASRSSGSSEHSRLK